MKIKPLSHTPGKWNVNISALQTDVIDEKGDIIAGIYLRREGGESEANAQRIVKAVNMHDDLIKHLSDAIERMDRAKGAIQRETGNGYGVLDTTELKAFLKEAKEGEIENPVPDIIDAEEKVYNLTYLRETMGHKKLLINEIIQVFLKECPLELQALTEAILRSNYRDIRDISHRMKPYASIMDIKEVHALVSEIERLSILQGDMDTISRLSAKVNTILLTAFKQMKSEKI